MSIECRYQFAKGQFSLDVNLTIPGTGVTSLLGPSGCGKTTLLRTIAGLEKHQNGLLRFGNEIWQNDEIFIPAHQRPLGYVFQESSLFEHLNVHDNVAYGAKRIATKQKKFSLQRSIELTGIGHLLTRNPVTLSGGERQRVAIARALAVNPGILLMDEPLASLDTVARQEMLPTLELLHDELDIPVIYVSHSPDEVARLADHLVLLEAGRVKATGAIADILTRFDLPLAHSDDAEALIEAVVAEHDDKYALTYLDFPGGRFTVAQKSLAIGRSVRLRVIARDVSLTLQHQTDTSILNIFPAVVDEITPLGNTQLTVRLLAGGVPLLSRITRKSAALLELENGKPVYAQAKTVALLS